MVWEGFLAGIADGILSGGMKWCGILVLWCISGEDPDSISTGVYISSCPRLGGLGRPPRPYKLGARVHLIYPLATLFFFKLDGYTYIMN